MKRLAVQIFVLLAVSAGLAFAANRLRTDRIALQADPTRYRYQDVRFVDLGEAERLHADPTTLFLDARDAESFAQRRVFGAVSFPADDIETAYAELRDFLAPDMPLVVYSKDLLLAVRAARYLQERGYDAAVLDGGWDAWHRARLPVE